MLRVHPIAWLRDRPRLADALLAAALLVATVATFVLGEPANESSRAPDFLGAVLVGVAIVPIAARRSRPLAVLGVATALQMAVHVVGYDGGGWTGIIVALYSVGAHIAGGRPRTVAVAAFAAATAVFLGAGVATEAITWEPVVGTVVTLPSAFFLGDNMRRRRERLVHLAERAERAERERELLARERVTEERNRIARDLHDVVAHSVSVMVIQAGAARRQLELDPLRAGQALENIEHTGREAMQEMRRILGVLRDESTGAALAPQPSLAAIEALVASDPSLPAVLEIDGAEVAVPPGVELSAYRVVQEALTNVRKHAGQCRRVVVRLQYEPRRMTVSVFDDGRGAAAASLSGSVPGHGLVGMRERVAACGGELDVGPTTGGGWTVRARFPVSPVEAVA